MYNYAPYSMWQYRFTHLTTLWFIVCTVYGGRGKTKRGMVVVIRYLFWRELDSCMVCILYYVYHLDNAMGIAHLIVT